MITDNQFKEHRDFVYTSPEKEPMVEEIPIPLSFKLYMKGYNFGIPTLEKEINKSYYNVDIQRIDKEPSYIMIYATTYGYEHETKHHESNFEDFICETLDKIN
jgi:hypothetical protein